MEDEIMERARRLKNNIKYIYLYNLFHSFIFAYVIERLFWRSRGISVTETVYLEIVYAVIILLTEIPSGVWADCWKRKNLIVIGQVLSMLEILILVFAKDFHTFALVMVLAGISGAVRSGSANALVYDTLKELGREKEFEKINGRIKAVDYGSHMVAALIGGLTAHYVGLLINYQMSVVSLCFAILFSMLLIEPRRTGSSDNEKDTGEEIEAKTGYKEIIRTAYVVIREKSFLRYVMFTGVIVGSTVSYMWEFWQNYVEALGIDMIFFGLISGVCSLGVLLAASKTYKVVDYFNEKRLDKRRLYKITMILTGLSFLSMFFIRNYFSIVLMVLINVVAGINETALEGDIHHTVKSEHRATVESVYSMVSRLMVIIVGLAFGMVSDKFGIFSGYGVLGGIIMISLVGLMFMPNKKLKKAAA